MSFNIMIPKDCYAQARAFLSAKDYLLSDFSAADSLEKRLQQLTQADGLIAGTEPYTEKLLDQASKLKVIARSGVGFDNIPLDYCTKRGIQVTYTPQANYQAVAEHSAALMLDLVVHMSYMDRQVRRGNWEIRANLRGQELYGKTLGIIGCGRIGNTFAQIAQAGFGMKNIL